MQVKKIYLLIITLIAVNCLYAQTDMQFWFVAPEINDYHYPSNPIEQRGQPTYLRFSNAENFDITVTISQPATPGFTPISVTVPANQTNSIQFMRGGGVGVYDLDEIENYLNNYPVTFPDPGNKGFKGLKIESTGRMTCYYEMAGRYNMELMSLKGRNALGTEFYVPFQTRYNPPSYSGTYPMIYSAIDIVATEDNTSITIEPTNDIMLILNTQTQHSGNYTIVLDQGETFSVVPYGTGNNTPWDIDRNKDLAGTHITSTKPIAVSTKDDLVADGTGAVDMVADQLVPINLLGMKYVIMAGRVIKNNGLNSWDNIYVIPIHDNTDIDVDDNGTVDYTIPTAGTQLRIPINNDNTVIAASDTILVYHVTGINPSLIPGGATNNYNQLGGAIIPTIDVCTGSYSVSFVRPYNIDFILNVMVRDGGINGFDPTYFTAADFTEVVPGEWWTASKTFSTADIPVGVVTTLENFDDKLFHLGIMHGSVDCFYGYFSDFNSINVQGNVGTTINTDHKACYGERVELVAYGGNSYFWKADKEPSFLADPTAERPVIYPTEDRRYTVIGYGDCGMSDSTQINVFVADPIDADFAIDNVIGCSPLDIMIENHSRDDWPVWKYQWYYGDGNSLIGDSTTAAAADTLYHSYSNTSDSVQNLKFTLVTENDFFCKDTLQTDIVVKPEIHAGFTPDITIGCNPLAVNFTDNSTTNTINNYRWIFGDGTIDNTVGNNSHVYDHTNTSDTVQYDVELQLRSPFYCRDTARGTISVYPYLEAKFTIDEDDGCSPLTVQLKNACSGADSIFLDYGDGTIDTLFNFIAVNHTYRNNDGVDEVDTNFIEMRIKNNAGCEKFWYDTVLVYPEFKADYNIVGGSYEGCNSRTVTFNNTTDDGTHLASRYLWEFDDGTSMDTTNNQISKVYNNTTSTDKTYNFRLTARSQYGCTDDTTYQIHIYRAYANFAVDNNAGCSPLPVKVTNNSIGDLITTWDWDYGDGHTDNVKNPNTYTYRNKTAADLTRPLMLQVTGTNGCSTSKTINILVHPEIKAKYTTAETTPASCDSLRVVFSTDIEHASLSGVIYDWDFGDGGSSAIQDPKHVYENLSSSSVINRVVDLHVETPWGCAYDTSSIIDVYPMVNAKFAVDRVVGCSPLSVNAVATEYIGVDEYNWTFGDGFNPTVSDPPAHFYPDNDPGVDNDTYTLKLNVVDLTGTCTDSDSITITVYDEVLADFNPKDSTDCDPFTLTFDNLSQNAISYKWDFGDGGTTSTDPTPTYEFVNPLSSTRVFNVELEATSDEGCVDTYTSTVNVLPTIEADFDIDVSEGCSQLTVTISNNYVGSQCYWYWDKDDRIINAGVLAAADSTVNFASFTKTYTNNSATSRTDSLTLIVGNGSTGCYEIFKRAITVHPSIDAAFDISPASGEGCNPLIVSFTNTTSGGSTYNWSFGDGSSTTQVSPTHTFTNTTTSDKTFTVRLTAESVNGCTDDEQVDITVYSKVVSDFSMDQSEGCPPFTTTIDNTSVGNSANTYQWLIDNIAVAGSPTDKSDFSHTYENTNTALRPYEVKLIATNPHGCTSEHTDIITVYEYVEASYSMSIDNGCTPLNVQFTDLSSVPTDTKYTWDFGDGASSGLSDPTHKFYNSSRTTDLTRTISLTVQSANYCSDDTSMTVDIYHQPLAKFYIDNTSSCPPLVSTLVKESQGEDMFEWRFDDGNTNTTDANLTYSWDNTDIDNIQIYKLELWVNTANSCKDSSSLDLSVFPKVTADYTIDKTGGCSPLEDVQFTNTSTSPATQFFWSFGDGATTNMENPMHDFANVGIQDRTYNVFFKAFSEYNCWDTITKQVIVYVQPDAEFYVDPVLLTFPDNIVALDNKTNSGPFSYLWEFGDINNSTSTDEEPGSFEYEHWGYKVIELGVTSQTNSNCVDSFSDTILIQPPKVNADFTTNINGGCWDGGLEVQFTAEPSAYAEVYEYEWDFGDGGTGEGQYITHVFDKVGTYNVQLKAISTEGAGEDYAYKKINVYANPEVSFEVSPKLAMLDPSTLEARVKFYNTSLCNDTAGCAYTWEFGDGNTALSRDVTHGYTELGKYDITLTAETAHGCRDSLTLYEEVEIIGAGQIAFPNAFTPDGTGPAENETFIPLSEGVIEYELFIYNRWGELIFTTKNLSEGWDGNIKGEPAKPDVYVWKAQGKFTNGRTFELAGDVTLIR